MPHECMYTHTHTHTHFLYTHTHTHTFTHTVPSRQTLINCMTTGKRHHCGVDGARQRPPFDGCPGFWAGCFVETLAQNKKSGSDAFALELMFS